MNSKSKIKIIMLQIFLGLFMLYWFLVQLTNSKDLFSNQGIMGMAKSEFTSALLPNIFIPLLTPKVVYLLCVVATISSSLIFFENYMILGCVLSWLFIVFLQIRAPSIGRVWTPYMGWMLLAFPAYFYEVRSNNFLLKDRVSIVIKASWLVAGVSYFVSGITKLFDVHWFEGVAISSLVGFPYKSNLYYYIIKFHFLLKFVNYYTLFVELSFLPLIIFKKLRIWVWFSIAIMHLGIILFMDISVVTFPMLIFHFFLFDMEWLPKMNLENTSASDIAK